MRHERTVSSLHHPSFAVLVWLLRSYNVFLLLNAKNVSLGIFNKTIGTVFPQAQVLALVTACHLVMIISKKQHQLGDTTLQPIYERMRRRIWPIIANNSL